ncbi:MAG: HAD family hydrolase [Synechococcaceae cyanobacterium]
MAATPLLVFDFDGVLVDGMAEYWWSARQAALNLLPELSLPEPAPVGFARLRPLIHKGWEMVLMAIELGRADFDLTGSCADYPSALQRARGRWRLEPPELQEALEAVRRRAIADDLPAWLALHRFYPGVPERLRRLRLEGSDWSVLTTKGGAFASQLLAAADLCPRQVHGHEQGSKPEVLERLLQDDPELWFIEDRRPTLEQVRASAGLEPVRCYLVSWGYLAPGDGDQLPPGIRSLDPETFQLPLALWP